MVNTIQAAIYDVPGCIVIRLDTEMNIWYVNSFGLRLLGYSRLVQIFNRPLASLLEAGSTHTAEFLAQIDGIGAHRIIRQLESPLLTGDGRRLWVSWTIEHRLDSDALLAPVFLVGADITNLRECVESSWLFRDIAESSPLGVLITDTDQRIRFANPAALAASGYAAEEVIGNTPHLFSSGKTPKETYRSMWATLNAGSSWTGEFVNRRKDGTIYVEKKHIAPLSNRDGVIGFYFSISEDQLKLSEFERRIEALSSSDLLTGLLNRAGFLRAITHATTGGGEHGLMVVAIDIDGFDTLNRILGSERADRLLVALGGRIKDVVRDVDVVARLGSDEFGVLLPFSDAPSESDCAEVASRLLGAIRQPFPLDDRPTEVCASIGIACFPSDGHDASELLACAASAMQKVKRAGGDAVARFDSALATADFGARELLVDLRDVVERNELFLLYQPQISLQTGAIVGLEALVRWQHPVRGMILPGHCIPAAEETGYIIGIGDWVLAEACRQMRRWLDAGFPPIKVAVNLSARQFRFSSLCLSVAEALTANRIKPPMLELEITEGAMMHDLASAIRTSERLKAIGVTLSLDDFGTGYSSLAYLSRFPIDMVKIDQSFVRDITSNPTNAAIAQAIIAMSHKLGKVALAEGIETEEQMYYLRRHDCDEMQGYFFSRPLSADGIAALRRRDSRVQFKTTGDETMPTVLLVDDEPNILAALKRLLRREGYRVLAAESGEEALALLARETVRVIVSDQRMPSMTGTEFFSRIRGLYPETVRLVLSGHSEIATLTDAINKGAIYKYLNKPWDDEHFKSEIRNAFRYWNERFGKA
ncbi:MAG TPA: EAL domain-containing protein [Accumulibacter sp.]|nr:EAL domain-containing protein [Accumulibacter sp.]